MSDSNKTSSEPSITSKYTDVFPSVYVKFPSKNDNKCDVIDISSDDELEAPIEAPPKNNISHYKEPPLIEESKEAAADCKTKTPLSDGKGSNVEDLKVVGDVVADPSCKVSCPNDIRSSDTIVVVIEDTSSSSGNFQSSQSSNSISNY